MTPYHERLKAGHYAPKPAADDQTGYMKTTLKRGNLNTTTTKPDDGDDGA